MARYLISFDHGAMDHLPDEEGPAVSDASLAVIQEAKDAGVWVFAEGVYPHDEVSASVVAPDGTVTDGTENKTSPESRSSTCHHARRRCSGPPSSPSPAAVHKRSASSRPTRPWELIGRVGPVGCASVPERRPSTRLGAPAMIRVRASQERDVPGDRVARPADVCWSVDTERTDERSFRVGPVHRGRGRSRSRMASFNFGPHESVGRCGGVRMWQRLNFGRARRESRRSGRRRLAEIRSTLRSSGLAGSGGFRP